MDGLSLLLEGFQKVLQPEYLFLAFAGCLLGTLVGVLPGIGPVAGITLLLPFTFQLDSTGTIIMLAGIYYGAQYGGSTTSILVNVPGESSSVVTAIDGHQMAQQGRAGPALSIAAIGSFIAGTVSVVLLMLLAPALVPVALAIGPREDFALMVLGLSMAVLLSGGSVRKALITLMIGFFLAMTGLDPITAQPRFTFGIPQLTGGIEIVALVVGLFGIAEVMSSGERLGSEGTVRTLVGKLWPSRKDLRDSSGSIARGTALGFIIGLVPGGGGIVSTLISYAAEKLVAKNRDQFGKGAIQGVAGPESANNSASTAAFVPLLTLGLPANPVVALILSALIVQGLQPGPRLLIDHADLFWAFVASMYLGNVVLIVLNLPLVGLWASLLRIPQRILLPLVVVLSTIGVYSVNNSIFDLIIMALAGITGYVMRKAQYPVAPLVLGFVLAPRLEQSFRQAMLISRGELSALAGGTIAPAMLITAVLILAFGLLYPIVKGWTSGDRGKHHELLAINED